ncbi:MAG TPA: ABC transporter permease [Anaerolineaceae bacterium]|nr:ABC transporter permease [Anaerolineaceae bacterium]
MKPSPFVAFMGAASSLLLIFVLLPLAAALFSTTPGSIFQSFGDPEVGRSLALTFSASALATGLTVLCGVPMAYLLARVRFMGKRVIESIIDLPIVLPHTASGIALLLVFGRQGILGKFLAPVGLTFTDNLGGIVVAMAFVSLPYLVNLSRESFALLDPELERAALVDGASPWQAFWHVIFPQAWNGVTSGILMMWARGISEFGAVVILAYNPKIIPVLVFERFTGFGLNAAQPIAVLMIVVVFGVFILLRFLMQARKEE